MGLQESILKFQIEHGIFDDAEFHGAEGIAKLAIDRGYETLSEKQKNVLEPYLNITCSGYRDPGGNYHDCSVELSDEELLDACHESIGRDGTICNSCLNEIGNFERQWERISRE